MKQSAEVRIRSVADLEDRQETLDQSFAQRLRLRAAVLVLEDGRLGDAVQPPTRNLTIEADSLASKQQHIETAVSQAFVVDDLTDAGDGGDRNGLDPGRARGVRLDLHDRHELVVVECVPGHLPISWLEDMEGQDHVREQDEVRQGEQPAQSGELAEIRVDIHGCDRASQSPASRLVRRTR